MWYSQIINGKITYLKCLWIKIQIFVFLLTVLYSLYIIFSITHLQIRALQWRVTHWVWGAETVKSDYSHCSMKRLVLCLTLGQCLHLKACLQERKQISLQESHLTDVSEWERSLLLLQMLFSYFFCRLNIHVMAHLSRLRGVFGLWREKAQWE